MGTNIVFCQMSASRNRQRHVAIRIHDVHIGKGCIAVILRQLHVVGRIGPVPAIGCVAFYDGAIHGMYQIPDEFRPEIVAAVCSVSVSACSCEMAACEASASDNAHPAREAAQKIAPMKLKYLFFILNLHSF